MRLRIPAPYRHPKSGIFWMRLRVPADLVTVVGKAEEKLSLRTRDPLEAKSAYFENMKKLEARWRNLRVGTTTISHKEAVAIAGDFYRTLVAQHEDDPGERHVAVSRLLTEQVAAGSPHIKIIRGGTPDLVEGLLNRMKDQNRAALRRYFETSGELVDNDSFERVLEAVNKAMAQGREQILRYVDGDYRPDPDGDRFPERKWRSGPQQQSENERRSYMLADVYERYATETKQAPSTKKKWGAIVAGVAKIPPDIRTITPEWCVSWKDALVKQGLSLRTIQFGHLAALRSTCEWAKTNLLISANPMEAIGVTVGKSGRLEETRLYDRRG